MSQVLKLMLLFILGWASFEAMALPNDDAEPMRIVADSSMFNYKTHTNIYEGNVHIDQGTTHLIADRVETHNNSKNKLETAIAYGLTKPAEYTTIPKEGDKIFYAAANIIRYYPLKSLVNLEGNVKIHQGENSFQGALIIYNMKEQIVTAPQSKTGQATIIIDPNQLKS